MRTWVITYNDRSCEPEIISEHKKQDNPALVCSLNGVKFFVVFANRSDHAASSYGTLADVVVVSEKKTNRFMGTAVNKIIKQD